MERSTQRLPPLVAAAMVSIILFCGAGVAAITGVLPAQGETQAATPALQAGSSEDPPPLTPIREPGPREPRPVEQVVRQPAPACTDCATVLGVKTVVVQEKPSGIGVVGGAVVGGVVGHQFGNGSGKDAMTAVGAIGGALAGNHIEKKQRQRRHYEVSLRMEDGSKRTLKLAAAPQVERGDRVRVEDGKLVPNF